MLKTRSVTRYGSVAAIVLASLASSCSSDDKPSTTTSDALVTAPMVPAIQSMLDLAAGIADSSLDLSACPLGDFATLVAKGPAAAQAAAANGDTEPVAYVYLPAGDPSHLQCQIGDAGGYTGLLPDGDFHDVTVGLLGDYVVTFEDDTAHRGGTLVSFCAEPIGAGGIGFCEADWYDSNVWIGVFVNNDASTAASEQWLTAILDDVVANVPQQATTIEPLN